jgi:beta-N-acetylhexosaminidase
VMAEMRGIVSRTSALAGKSLDRAERALGRLDGVHAVAETGIRGEFATYFDAVA